MLRGFMDPHKALETLLLSMFPADELRLFLRYLPDGERLSKSLPGANASAMALAHGVVEALAGTGYIGEIDFWRRLAAERPRRIAEIEDVRQQFAKSAATSRLATGAPAPEVVPAAPPVLKLLLASASPERAVRLRVDEEFRQIVGKLRASRYRDRLEVIQSSALRFEDLRTALLEHEPHILHLSCHGEPDGSLRFESANNDQGRLVPKKNLLKLLHALHDNLRLVVFAACHSAEVARDVPPTIGLSIGMSDAVFDKETIEFTLAFYEALAYGKSVQKAFDVALADLDQDQIPQLYPSPAEDPDNRRHRPLIDPASA